MRQELINYPKVIYRTDQPKKDGSNPFCLQIHLNGKKKQITIPVWCKPMFFDLKTKRIKYTHPNCHQLNLLIEAKYKKAYDIIYNAQLKDEPITMEGFLLKYNREQINHSDHDFYAFTDNEINLENKKTGKAPGTLKKYRDQFNKLKKYKTNLQFNDITETFLANLEEYMRETLGNGKGGSSNTLKFIRKFLYVAIKKGLTTNNPFKNYQIIEPKSDKVKYLEIEELQRIKVYFETLEHSHKHYLTIKSFLFCCYTGCRYGDGKKFKLADIVNNCIDVQMQKTKKMVHVPLMPQTIELLNYELDNNLPNLKTPCDQTCNRALKEVAKICKINKPITTHYARHTFGTTAINNGVPGEIVQKIMGHATSKQTGDYAKVNHKTTIEGMAKLNNIY